MLALLEARRGRRKAHGADAADRVTEAGGRVRTTEPGRRHRRLCQLLDHLVDLQLWCAKFHDFTILAPP